MKSLPAKFLSTLALLAAPLAPAGAVPVTSGLILNFQSDNINGNNNIGLANNAEVTAWVDVLEGSADPNQNNANVNGAKNYLNTNVTNGTPNYIAVTSTGRPGVQFTRASGTAGDALGSNSNIEALLDNNSFTAFVVASYSTSSPTGVQRALQFGNRGGTDKHIVGLTYEGYRFNGNTKLFTPNLLTAGGVHTATYSMALGTPVGGAGVNANFRVDGNNGTFGSSVDSTGSITIVNNPSDANLDENDGFSIGAGQGNNSVVNDPFNGIMYAILVYNRILDATETAQVESFLNNKFVVAIPEASAWTLVGAVGLIGGLSSAWRSRARRNFDAVN